MIPLPGYVDPECWQAMLDMRKAKKVPTTGYAEKLLLCELQKLKDAGHDPQSVIEQSIRRGYTDFWPVMPKDLCPVVKTETTVAYVARVATESALDKARVSRPPPVVAALADKMRAK